MRKKLAVASLFLVFAARTSRAASAEPELIPFTREARPAKPARAAPVERAPRLKRPPPSSAPLEKDELRTRLREGPPKREVLTFRTRVWFARSEVLTRYSIQIPREYIDPPAEVFYGETEERVADGVMLVHSAEVAPLEWFSMEFEFGQDRRKGTYTDRFWLHSPHSDTLTDTGNGAVWHRPDHEDDTVYIADNDAQRQWLSGNLHFRLAEGRVSGSDEIEVRHAFDFSAGGHRFIQNSRYTNLARVLSTGKLYPQQPLGPIAGYDSTYSARWIGPHIGIREQVSIPLGFRFDGQIIWGPFMKYFGEGFENMNSDLRPTSPNYSDQASGSAVHMRFGAAWRASVVALEAGYMRLSFTSHHGERTYFLKDGTTAKQAVELTTTDVSGLYVAGSLRF